MDIMFEPVLNSNLYNKINIFSIVIMLMLLYKTVFSGNNILHKNIYRNTLLVSIIFSISDIIRTTIPASNEIVYDGIEMVYFGLFTFTSYLFFLHFGLIIGNDSIDSRKDRLFFFIPCLIIVILNILVKSYIARFVFSCIYTLLALIYMGKMLVYVTKKNRYYIDRTRFILYTVIPLIGGIVHIIDKNIPMICGVVIAEIIMYIDLVELLVTIDSLTQISNRANLLSYLEKKVTSNPKDLYIMMIDADNFKYINDTYGHLEGDKCLVRLSDVLKESCTILTSRAFICRYGGDEFTVVVQCTDQAIYNLKYAIYENLYDCNMKDDVDYTFEVSIGIAKYNPKVHSSIRDFIDDADNNLYNTKRRKK